MVKSTKEKELAEIRRKAADAKHEAEIKALEQKQAMETQVTQYRVELERQLVEQRQAFELEAQKTQATLEAKCNLKLSRPSRDGQLLVQEQFRTPSRSRRHLLHCWKPKANNSQCSRR